MQKIAPAGQGEAATPSSHPGTSRWLGQALVAGAFTGTAVLLFVQVGIGLAELSVTRTDGVDADTAILVLLGSLLGVLPLALTFAALAAALVFVSLRLARGPASPVALYWIAAANATGFILLSIATGVWGGFVGEIVFWPVTKAFVIEPLLLALLVIAGIAAVVEGLRLPKAAPRRARGP